MMHGNTSQEIAEVASYAFQSAIEQLSEQFPIHEIAISSKYNITVNGIEFIFDNEGILKCYKDKM